MSRVGKFVAVSACALCLSACGEAKLHGAVPKSEVEHHVLITSLAPGEVGAVTFATEAQCRTGSTPTPMAVTKQFDSTAAAADVKVFYSALIAQDEWFHRADTSSSYDQTLNYSRQNGDQYWQLHLTIPRSSSGRYEVRLDAYDPDASCSS